MAKNLVMAFSEQRSYRVRLGGLEREFPLVNVSRHLWIASDAEFILGDVDLISEAAKLLAMKVERRRVDVILTAEAKSIPLALELSKRLGLRRFIVARKNLKSYMGDHVSRKVKSITTGSEQELHLTKEEIAFLSGKRVCLLDDVVSTGSTLNVLEVLAEEAGGKVACRAAVWREGPWYTGSELLYVDTLPVFVDSQSPLAEQIRS